MFNNYTDFALEEFDQYNPTNGTITDLNHSLARLNKRHLAIIQSMPDIWKNANVLDIACANARWTFAAIQAGAKFVEAVEPRSNMIDTGKQLLNKYQVSDEKYNLILGSAFDVLPTLNRSYDVVLCMGFLGHTYRQPELFSLIKKLQPKHLIIDSGICSKKGMVCSVYRAENKNGFAYPDKTSVNEHTYTSVPSLTLIKDMIDFYDFDIINEVNWKPIVEQHGSLGIEDYANESRITLFCQNRLKI